MVTADSQPFLDLAKTAEAVAGTRSRNDKAKIIGEYFATLGEADLVIAARFLAGQVFPLWDQRTMSVGGAAIFNALIAVTGLAREDLSARLVPLGDLGLLTEQVLSISAGATEVGEPFSLASVDQAFGEMAATSGSLAKTTLLTQLVAKSAPLEAKYLIKLIAGDLRIGLKEGSVEDAIARLAEAPVGAVQWANMLTGDIGETALLARTGALDTAHMRLFHPIKFMLATPAADLNDVSRQMPAEFIVEDKFDGIRAQAHIAPAAGLDPTAHGVATGNARVALFSRTLDEITGSFPELIAPLGTLAAGAGSGSGSGSGGFVLDGEIVPVRGDEILPFADLQKRLGRKKVTAEQAQAVPVAYVIFDVLYGDGRVQLTEPLTARRAILDGLVLDGSGNINERLRRARAKVFSDSAALDAEFDAARARGNEGLMVKNPSSLYKPGRRGRDWLKIKRALASLDVVVTAVEVGNGRRSHLLSDYTFAVKASDEDPSLLNVGKAYSGLTDAELAELSDWFREHTLKEFGQGRVRIVEPRIVIEVTFDRVQESKRHKSGYSLRFPRILRLRPDKSVEEIDTLETVRQLAK